MRFIILSLVFALFHSSESLILRNERTQEIPVKSLEESDTLNTAERKSTSGVADQEADKEGDILSAKQEIQNVVERKSNKLDSDEETEIQAHRISSRWTTDREIPKSTERKSHRLAAGQETIQVRNMLSGEQEKLNKNERKFNILASDRETQTPKDTRTNKWSTDREFPNGAQRKHNIFASGQETNKGRDILFAKRAHNLKIAERKSTSLVDRKEADNDRNILTAEQEMQNVVVRESNKLDSDQEMEIQAHRIPGRWSSDREIPKSAERKFHRLPAGQEIIKERNMLSGEQEILDNDERISNILASDREMHPLADTRTNRWSTNREIPNSVERKHHIFAPDQETIKDRDTLSAEQEMTNLDEVKSNILDYDQKMEILADTRPRKSFTDREIPSKAERKHNILATSQENNEERDIFSARHRMPNFDEEKTSIIDSDRNMEKLSDTRPTRRSTDREIPKRAERRYNLLAADQATNEEGNVLSAGQEMPYFDEEKSNILDSDRKMQVLDDKRPSRWSTDREIQNRVRRKYNVIPARQETNEEGNSLSVGREMPNFGREKSNILNSDREMKIPADTRPSRRLTDREIPNRDERKYNMLSAGREISKDSNILSAGQEMPNFDDEKSNIVDSYRKMQILADTRPSRWSTDRELLNGVGMKEKMLVAGQETNKERIILPAEMEKRNNFEKKSNRLAFDRETHIFADRTPSRWSTDRESLNTAAKKFDTLA